MNEQQKRLLAKLCDEEPEEVLKVLFQEEFWPPSLETFDPQTRFEDDSCQGTISVQFSDDGDGHIMILGNPDPQECKMGFRFRTFFGGGQSLRVRKALLFLALAIKWDNAEFPQQREPRQGA